jgi:hypothetical protein
MNRLYRRTDRPFIERWKDAPEADSCEHVLAGIPICGVGCEDDSFGPVSRILMCHDCLLKAAEENRAYRRYEEDES